VLSIAVLKNTYYNHTQPSKVHCFFLPDHKLEMTILQTRTPGGSITINMEKKVARMSFRNGQIYQLQTLRCILVKILQIYL